MAVAAEAGIVRVASRHSVADTVRSLERMLASRSITLFARVDHAAEATRVGMEMPPTQLLIFGNPRAGTPLMVAAPSSALDLPLKILVAEDAEGSVWISYNSVAYLEERHGLPEALLAGLAVVGTLAAQAAA
jgi:uncharacterized protein (DUF302 family)